MAEKRALPSRLPLLLLRLGHLFTALWRRFFPEPIMPKSYFERGRDAKTGRFIPVAKAKKRKRTAVVERVKR